MALQLVTPGSLMFGDIEGGHRNPEHVSRQFARDVERCGQVPADHGCTTCGTRTPRCCKGAELHQMQHSASGVRTAL